MIIKCKKRQTDYKPVKGNEKEITNHLFEHNYYDCWRVEKIDGILYFDVGSESYFTNEESGFFKCESDGKINYVEDKNALIEYTAVPFTITDKDMLKIFQVRNFVSFERDSTTQSLLKKWSLKTKDKSFSVKYRDILIFDESGRIVDCLMDNGKSPAILLASHGYMVDQDD